MLVVPLQSWVDLGKFPRSTDKLQRQYEETDVVVVRKGAGRIHIHEHPTNSHHAI